MVGQINLGFIVLMYYGILKISNSVCWIAIGKMSRFSLFEIHTMSNLEQVAVFNVPRLLGKEAYFFQRII